MPPMKRICRDDQLPLDDGPVPAYKRRPPYIQNQLRKIREAFGPVQESVTQASPEVTEDSPQSVAEDSPQSVAEDSPQSVAEESPQPVAAPAPRRVLRQINFNTEMDPALSRLLAAADMTTEEIRAERIHKTKEDRLQYLLKKVNAETPPPWDVSTRIWYEIDQLENSIEAYKQKVAK
ncbi:uncharacterized protein DMAD_02201 [Drosophila madeirensis]|uniref:Uncharacterized protein n=1 Tax=Drosophila madeirensis TaxID=30013 RepID=A0AAU9G3R4_DROMD